MKRSFGRPSDDLRMSSRTNEKTPRLLSYLEIYVREDGKLVFDHLTKDTSAIVKKISGYTENLENIYCG